MSSTLNVVITGTDLMDQPIPEADEFIEKRKKIQNTGQLRYEKMIVMRVGERRHTKVQRDRQRTKEKNNT